MNTTRGLLTALFIAIMLAVLSPAQAQICNRKIPPTTSPQHFKDNGDGSITDQRTGLQWSRCSLGQTWENDRCQGEPQALPYAIVSLVAEPGWRLPTITELSSLVELRCSKPAINLKLFPATPVGIYWTDTRFVNRDGEFWQVHFLHGEAVSEKADNAAFVRWVKDGAREK